MPPSSFMKGSRCMPYLIKGGKRLEGSVAVHGAKNAVLPILAATILCDECSIGNCPDLTDISVTLDILRHLGSEAERSGSTIHIVTHPNGESDVPRELMSRMRSSVIFLGGMLARYGRAELTNPGGCELGARPIDMHIEAMEKLGAQVHSEQGRMICTAPGGLSGAEIDLRFPSVGATENVLIAAATAKGRTVLRGGAREPEIHDLASFLNECGARIVFEDDGSIEITGVEKLSGCTHRVIPDRIAACTYLTALATTGGRGTVTAVEPMDMMTPLAYLNNAGCIVRVFADSVEIVAAKRLRSFGAIHTAPYPGFPTDLQAIYMAAACTADGSTRFDETIFESRYKHAAELTKADANIAIDGRSAVVEGKARLCGADMCCTDLRGGAAAVIAALAADGTSRIRNVGHIERGYERFAQNLALLGADITPTD